MRLCLSALLTLGLVACAADASKIEETTVNDMRQGQTTLAQVVGRFGRPSILSHNIDGTQTAAYVHGDPQSGSPAVIPLIAALAGKSSANVDSIIFSFDAAGILSDYKQTRVQAPAPVSPVGRPSTMVSHDKPAKALKQTPSDSDLWNIRLEASGQRENR